MQTSATPTSTDPTFERAAQRGFSLLEMLVVVTIIGILVGAVVLSIDVVGADREIKHEVQRLRSIIDFAQEDALMQTRDYGVMFTETGYKFYVYDYKTLKWIEVVNDRVLGPHTLAPRLGFEILLDDRLVKLAPDFESQDVENAEPQVMVLASGEVTPFEANVYRDRAGGHFALVAELDGTLTMGQEGFDER
jgi:general secretion pathway protein H